MNAVELIAVRRFHRSATYSRERFLTSGTTRWTNKKLRVSSLGGLARRLGSFRVIARLRNGPFDSTAADRVRPSRTPLGGVDVFAASTHAPYTRAHAHPIVQPRRQSASITSAPSSVATSRLRRHTDGLTTHPIARC